MADRDSDKGGDVPCQWIIDNNILVNIRSTFGYTKEQEELSVTTATFQHHILEMYS